MSISPILNILDKARPFRREEAVIETDVINASIMVREDNVVHRYLLLLTAFVLLVLIGCSTQSDPVISNEDVIGIWEVTSGSHYIRFDEDGAFHEAPSLMLVRNPLVAPPGEYWFESNQLHIETPEENEICGAMIAIYEVQLLENSNFQLTLVDDTCERRANWLNGREYTLVE